MKDACVAGCLPRGVSYTSQSFGLLHGGRTQHGTKNAFAICQEVRSAEDC
jgi:hypothetical protein